MAVDEAHYELGRSRDAYGYPQLVVSGDASFARLHRSYYERGLGGLAVVYRRPGESHPRPVPHPRSSCQLAHGQHGRRDGGHRRGLDRRASVR